MYKSMVDVGVSADSRTFPYVLKVCADARERRKGEEVHGSVFKTGFSDDVFVGNTLISFYGAIESVEAAKKVFDAMSDRDAVTWNSMITVFSDHGMAAESVRCFAEMVRVGSVMINQVTVITTLPACAVGFRDGKMGMTIHGYILKLNLDSSVNVGNSLIDMYIKSGFSETSLEIFSGMIEKTVVSWNTIIGGLVFLGKFSDAVFMFRSMLSSSWASKEINSITISSLLPGIIELGHYPYGREIHGYAVRRSMVTSDIFVANSLLDMYSKSGRVKEASTIFQQIPTKNAISWNIMIANYAQNNLMSEALNLVRAMQTTKSSEDGGGGGGGHQPNAVTLINILPACSRIPSLKHGKEIHARGIRSGISSDPFILNALIDTYSKCSRPDLAHIVFKSVVKKCEITYNSLIVGFSQNSLSKQSLELFSEMARVGLTHDSISISAALSACTNLPSLKHGTQIHGVTIRRNFHNHQFVANSLLDLYTKTGRFDLARAIFDRVEPKDVVSWNTMLLGYAMHGELDLLFEFFELMKSDETIEYDSVSFVAVLSGCSHHGLVEKGRAYFNQLVATSGRVEVTQTHYACMVDLLGRAGLMEEAMAFIATMSVEPSSDVWGALLGACRVHGDLMYGRLAAERLFILEPGNSGYYTLLANMYAEVGNWDEAGEIRVRMKSRGVKKNPGFSWVQSGDRIQAFVVGEPLDEALLE